MFIQNAFAINYDSAWNIFDASDLAVLHAACCVIAQNRDLISGTEGSPDTLYHKGEMMKTMTLRLREESHTISDGDVLSVAVLVVVEVSYAAEAVSARILLRPE